MKIRWIFLFYFINIYLFSFNILFISQYYDIKKDFIQDIEKITKEILNFNPICHYSEYFNFYYLFEQNIICKTSGYSSFELSNKSFFELMKKIGGEIDLAIILLNSNFTASQAGTIGEENFRIIIITNRAKDRTILHELGHAIFNLGDEYEGDIQSIPLEIKFKNLSLSPINSEWQQIKELFGEKEFSNYEGGLYRAKGVYRAYKECLMRDINKELCPVCFYYAVQVLNKLTQQNKEVVNLYNKKLKVEKFLLKEIFM